MNADLIGALRELEKERGISREVLYEAIEAAILSAYKKDYGNNQNVSVNIEESTGSIKVYARKAVVEEVEAGEDEISLEEAKRIDPRYEVGDMVETEVTPKDFGRIAAQNAKQVVVQRIREAERSAIYDEFSNREGDIVTCIVYRHEGANVIVDLGKTEGLLLPSDQIRHEPYNQGIRLKVYIVEVRKTTKGPQVIVSRTHPDLLRRLFELEVPEIHDGIVEINAVAREAGNRSKIAVSSRDPKVDPVGACVGTRGMRVQTVVRELRGEKIDIISYHPDPGSFVARALSPAKVSKVIINSKEKQARAVVPDNQLSLAIGKEGQNARLAAKLTGWKIDIKSESEMQELAERQIFGNVSTDEPVEEKPPVAEPAEEEALDEAILEGVGPESIEEDISAEAEPETEVELDEVFDDLGADDQDGMSIAMRKFMQRMNAAKKVKKSRRKNDKQQEDDGDDEESVLRSLADLDPNDFR
ncbi:MAG: transcription termination factor NusA [Limnochordia bacterium]|nr:transcription termination factor NusA [Limnochordia bacterium]MDD2629778.1 transcription termination factor NusA [Limnochordia bacterium]MDD4518006.1 transcription termination factor NusA [Limnochordia bacterium]